MEEYYANEFQRNWIFQSDFMKNEYLFSIHKYSEEDASYYKTNIDVIRHVGSLRMEQYCPEKKNTCCYNTQTNNNTAFMKARLIDICWNSFERVKSISLNSTTKKRWKSLSWGYFILLKKTLRLLLPFSSCGNQITGYNITVTKEKIRCRLSIDLCFCSNRNPRGHYGKKQEPQQMKRRNVFPWLLSDVSLSELKIEIIWVIRYRKMRRLRSVWAEGMKEEPEDEF